MLGTPLFKVWNQSRRKRDHERRQRRRHRAEAAMKCATCYRPANEHTLRPGRGHPETGCESFAFSVDPNGIHHPALISDAIERLHAGEEWLHCPCMSTYNLRPCPNCGFFFCSRCLGRHVSPQCPCEKDSRHPGMPHSQPMPSEADEALMGPVTRASVRAARLRAN